MRRSAYIVRQGDVLLIKVDTELGGAERPARGGHRIIQEGEATGHAHYVAERDSVLLHPNDALRRVAEEYGVDPRWVAGGLRITALSTTLWHGTPVLDPAGPKDADHAPIVLQHGDYVIVRPREFEGEDDFRLVAD